MRLRHVLPFAAVLALAGCNDQPGAKSTVSARAPIPAAACPPIPACVPEATAKSAAKASDKAVKAKARAHKVSHRKAHRAKARRVASAERARYEEGLAGGPPTVEYRRYRGPDIPTRPYAYRRYGEGGYRYGALPPPDGGYDAYEDDAASGYYYRHGGAGRGGRSTERYSSHESGGWRREGGHRRGDSDYGYRSGGEEDRQAEAFVEDRYDRDGRSMRSERRDAETSTAFHEEHSESGGRGPCCVSGSGGAAGFDRNGFLTWPGKVPARP